MSDNLTGFLLDFFGGVILSLKDFVVWFVYLFVCFHFGMAGDQTKGLTYARQPLYN